jgi:hypothetical protein
MFLERAIEPNELGRALSNFSNYPELDTPLAQILINTCRTGNISYREVEQIAKDRCEDILLLAFEWRLLLPIQSARGTLEWGDAVLLLKSEEMYKMPNVIKCLVEEATQTGRWNPESAIAEIFKVMGESEWEKMPRLVQKFEEGSKDYKINAIQIKEICGELDLEHKIDPLIAELKGSGVMSPNLGSLTRVIRQGSPIYELNPSLLRTGQKNAYKASPVNKF